MNYFNILPRVYDLKDGYNYSVHAVPFISVEDVQKITQEMPKFSAPLKSKAQQVLDLLQQFPTMVVDLHAHNYSIPSKYVEHYCVVQSRPEGREPFSHKKTDVVFLSDPSQWKWDCLKELSKFRSTVEKINDKCKIKINMACVQSAMDFCEKIESGTVCVEAVDMRKMVTTTSYAVFDITNGGYVNNYLKSSCETLNGAELFFSEINARNYINTHARTGRHYTIVPIQMHAGPHLEVVSRGVPSGIINKYDQKQLAALQKEILLSNMSDDKTFCAKIKKSKI